MNNNPFGVHNPEQVDADYIVRNFVDIYTDLPSVCDTCNTFIHGARGTGKSMLLRSLEPEVMIKANKAKNIASLPYFAIHVPLKKAEFSVTELSQHPGYIGIILGEHLLVMYSMFRLAKQMVAISSNISNESAQNFSRRFNELLDLSSIKSQNNNNETNNVSSEMIFSEILKRSEQEIMRVRQYYKRIHFMPQLQEYNGPLTSFLDFLVPLAEEVGTMKDLSGVPLFLMLDDADNLPIVMQRVLNSWVSTRSTRAVCLKISTQLGYATYRTIDNRIIESPHDFSEVNIGTIYTTDQDRYSNRIREIVVKRLVNAKTDTTPEEFFPKDEKQAKRLDEIKREILVEWTERQINPPSDRRGPARANDDVTRYTIPKFMRELKKSKSTHTYSYAGFKSLVDLSGGVVRSFLEPVSRMYDKVYNPDHNVLTIPVGIQDNIIRDWSREFVERLSRHNRDNSLNEVSLESDDMSDAGLGLGHSLGHLEAQTQDFGRCETSGKLAHGRNDDQGLSLHTIGHETVMYERLNNLINGLGKLFRQKLSDPDASEQRVFSVVVRGKIPDDLAHVLGLAVRLGYLQRFDNSAKEATGSRLPRYILARRLGPYYDLDVSGYAAHLSVTANDLALALWNPGSFVNKRLNQDKDSAKQLTLDL